MVLIGCCMHVQASGRKPCQSAQQQNQRRANLFCFSFPVFWPSFSPFHTNIYAHPHQSLTINKSPVLSFLRQFDSIRKSITLAHISRCRPLKNELDRTIRSCQLRIIPFLLQLKLWYFDTSSSDILTPGVTKLINSVNCVLHIYWQSGKST